MKPDEEIIDAVIRAAEKKKGSRKLSCVQAFELAERFGLSKFQIGRICNENNIKISNCQLGCFK